MNNYMHIVYGSIIVFMFVIITVTKAPDIKVIKIKNDNGLYLYLNEEEHFFNWGNKDVGPRYKCYLDEFPREVTQ